MKIATLGPEGTFSHEAVLRYKRNPDIIFKNTIWDVFYAVENGEADKGVVPMENSTSGTIGFTLDAMIKFNLKIYREIMVPIEHNLCGSSLKTAKFIYTHPETYSQCAKFLRQNIKGFKIIKTASNSDSALKLSKNRNRQYAAIIPKLPMEKYKLKCLAKGIQDRDFNTTRFVVLAKEPAELSKKNRTSILVYPSTTKSGLVYNLTKEFAKRKINLSKVESRPYKGKLGSYIIFIEIEAHLAHKSLQSALKAIEKNHKIKILGSCPRMY